MSTGCAFVENWVNIVVKNKRPFLIGMCLLLYDRHLSEKMLLKMRQ